MFSETKYTFLQQDSDNPDLRDRGYIYWRLLSTDPAAAKVKSLMGCSRRVVVIRLSCVDYHDLSVLRDPVRVTCLLLNWSKLWG